MREKYIISSGNILRNTNLAVQFDELRGDVMFRSDVNFSDSLDTLVFGVLKQEHPEGKYLKRSGVHMRFFYRYFLPCKRNDFREILKILKKRKFKLKKTTKLWRK